MWLALPRAYLFRVSFFGPEPIQAHEPLAWVSAMAIPLLRGDALPAAIVRRMAHCWAALPEAAQVFQIGLMLARQMEPVRLCIRNMPSAYLGDYLQRTGWDGAAGALALLVASLAPLVDRIDVDLDVGETVLPKIGLECYFQAAPDVREKLTRFLDYLSAQTWCCPSKRDALLAYPGYVHERTAPERWPLNLLQASHLLGPGRVSMFLRFLHHIKVVYHPDGHVEAKAYLAVSHCWWPWAALRHQQLHVAQTTV